MGSHLFVCKNEKKWDSHGEVFCIALQVKTEGTFPGRFFPRFFFGSYFSLFCYAALFERLVIGTLFSFQTGRETETLQNLRRPLFMTFLDVSYS